MSSADIDEIYEKLLQFYEGYTDPKRILHYYISELVREGRTREDAIITLYEKKAKLTPAEAEKLREAIRKKKEEAIEQQIKEHKKNVEKLTLLFSKGELDEESYKAAIKPLEEKITRLEREKKEEETVKPKRELVELPVPLPTAPAPTKRLGLKTISKYFLHGFAFSILFLILGIAWVFALAVLVGLGYVIGFVIGLGLLAFIVGFLNSEITGFLWFTVEREFWSLLFHGGVLFVALLIVNGVFTWIPNMIFPSVYVQIITFIIGIFVNGLVGKKVAEIWQEETV